MDGGAERVGPYCRALSPAGTRGNGWLSLHLGQSATYSTISLAISANGRLAPLRDRSITARGSRALHYLEIQSGGGGGAFADRGPDCGP